MESNWPTCLPTHLPASPSHGHAGAQVGGWGKITKRRMNLDLLHIILHIGFIGPSPPLSPRLLLSQPHARITGPSDRYHQQPRTGIASPLLLVAIGLIGLGLWYGFALRLVCPRLLIGFCFGNCLTPGFGTAHLRAYARKCIPFG